MSADVLAVLARMSARASFGRMRDDTVGSAQMQAENQADLSAIAVVDEQQRILRQLATWNRNPNGDGVELDEICAAAELLVGRASPDEPRHGIEQLATVAGLVAALVRIRDHEGRCETPVRNSVKKSSIARAALTAARMDPQP